MEPWHESLKHAMEILMGKRRSVESYGMWESESQKDEDHPLMPYHCTEELAIKSYLPELASEGSEENG